MKNHITKVLDFGNVIFLCREIEKLGNFNKI